MSTCVCDACCSMLIVTVMYFSKWPPMASAMSPKHERIGGLTLRLSLGLCRFLSSSPSISSQYGSSLASSARQMSPTTPTATWHTCGRTEQAEGVSARPS